jgi:hypothetical protein
MMVPVAAIGLFDLWADFRAPKQKKTCKKSGWEEK